MKALLTAMALALVLFSAGCMSGLGPGEQVPSPTDQTAAVEPAGQTAESPDVPFIAENDTVEIGEMI